MSIALAFFNTAFVPLLAKVLPLEVRARTIAARGIRAGITSTLAVLVAGKILDLLPFPFNFQAIFALAFVTAQMSTILVARVHIPPLLDDPPPPPKPLTADLVGPPPMVIPLRSAAFWRHTLAAVIFILGIYLPIALYPILLVDRLHATNGWIGALAMAGGLAAVGLSSLWGRACARYRQPSGAGGQRSGLRSGAAGASLAPNLLTYAPVAVAQVGLLAIVGQGLLQCLYDVLPARRHTHYLAMYSVVANCAVAGAPPLPAPSLLGALGMPTTFRLGAGCVLLGSILLGLAVRHK